MAATLTSIAAEARVSTMTVSRALRGLGRVDPETRRRILAIADREGYARKDRSAMLGPSASGAAGAGYLRLLLVAAPGDHQGGYTALVQDVLAQALATCGGRLARVPATGLEALLAAIDAHQAQGLVLRCQVPTSWIQVLVRRLPVVYAASFDHQCGVDSVYANEHRSAAMLYQRLVDLGHRHIAWLGLTDRHRGDRQQLFEAPESACLTDRLSASIHAVRHAAWASLAQCQPGECRQPLILHERDWSRQSLAQAAETLADRLLALDPGPSAAVVSSQPAAAALATVLRRRGLRLPRDLSLATYAGSPGSAGSSLAAVVLPMAEIAAAIPELVRRRLANPAAPALSMQFETTLRTGRSLAPPRRR